MSIYFPIAGLLNMIIIIIIFASSKKIGLRTQLAFWILIGAEVFALATDLICCILLYTFQEGYSPESSAIISTKIYLSGLILLAFAAVNYIVRDTINTTKGLKIELPISIGICTAGIIHTCLLGLHMDTTGFVPICKGPGINASYAFCGLFLGLSIIFIHFYHKNMNKKRAAAFLNWLSIWCLSAIVEFIWKDFLIVSFGSTLGLLVLFIKLENPDLNLDKETKLFNHTALKDFVRQTFESKRFFMIYKINLQFITDSISDTYKHKLIMDFSKGLGVLSNFKAFRETNRSFYLICMEQYVNPEETIIQINNMIVDNSYVNVKYIVVSNPYEFPDTESLAASIRYIEDKKLNDSNKVYYVSNKLASIIEEDRKMNYLLKNAIDKNLVDVYYQPIYNIKTNRFECAEALVRIKDEKGNIITPPNFIGIAEETGLIVSLGEKVFRKVCELINSDDFKSLKLDYINVNLSVIQCSSKNMVERYKLLMEEYKIDPGKINFEILEANSKTKKEEAMVNISSLLEYGTSFSLDDFGINDGFEQLVDLPLSVVKFNYSIVKSYFTNATTKIIMDSAINLVNGLGLNVVLEGIETAEEYNIASKLNINYIQGFYFTEPLPEKEFVDFIKNINGDIA